MFFDALAVFALTFFAALGMVEAAEWLLRNPLRKDIKKKVFIVAKAYSVSEEELEPALRTLLSETEGQKRRIFLDCSEISDRGLIICENLKKRFDCEIFFSRDELVSLIDEYLHAGEKTV